MRCGRWDCGADEGRSSVLNPVSWLVSALAIGVFATGTAVRAERDLLALSSAVVGDSLPPQWQRIAVRGQRSPMSVVREERGERFLSISGQGRAAWFALDLRSQPLLRSGAATLEYRLPLLPAGADLTIAERSDAALRLYFVFEEPRRFLPSRRVFFYSLGAFGSGPRVKRDDRVCDIRLSAASTSEWQRLAVSPAADAARDCGWEDGQIVAVGMMQDTDQTGARAAAEVRSLIWRD